MLDHLPERDRPAVKRRLRQAWKEVSHREATSRLEALAGDLAHSHPGAAASLREGLAETVTLQRLGVHQQLRKTLSSTNSSTAASTASNLTPATTPSPPPASPTGQLSGHPTTGTTRRSRT
jgi:transposase-like protein